LRAEFLQRFAQQAAAAADIQDPGAFDLTTLRHVGGAHRIDQMQWPELPGRVPEPMRNGIEFADFRGVRVHGRKLLPKWATPVALC
jgi:hypothetical protein